MIALLSSPKENIVALKVSGSLTKPDYDRILPTLETKIRQFGKIRLYAEIEQLGLPTIQALWEDLKMDIKHYNDFSHIAVVSEPDWLAAITKLVSPLVPAEVRTYSAENKAAAMLWLAS